MEDIAVANRIRALRKLRGYTQQTFAKKLGVSLAVLGAVERGVRRLDPKLLLKVMAALELDEHALRQQEAPLQSRTGFPHS